MALSVAEFARSALDCRIVEIGDLPLYNEDEDASPPAPYKRFRDEIASSDGVLFYTPEYNRGIPGALKNAFDVGSRPYGHSVWDKTPAAIISASPSPIGAFGANHHLRQCCVFLNMPVMQQPEAYLGQVSPDKFDESGRLREGPLCDFVLGISFAFGRWIDLIEHDKKNCGRRGAHAVELIFERHPSRSRAKLRKLRRSLVTVAILQS
jgi:chromate reductase